MCFENFNLAYTFPHKHVPNAEIGNKMDLHNVDIIVHPRFLGLYAVLKQLLYSLALVVKYCWGLKHETPLQGIVLDSPLHVRSKEDI